MNKAQLDQMKKFMDAQDPSETRGMIISTTLSDGRINLFTAGSSQDVFLMSEMASHNCKQQMFKTDAAPYRQNEEKSEAV